MLAVLLLVAAVQDTTRPAPIPPGAYADAGTGQLVARARAARRRNEWLVTSYSATVTQRIGAGIHALSRDRMLYHQELAARIEWYRDRPSRVTVLGAREGTPVASLREEVPDDLAGDARSLVINPAEDYLRIIGATGDNGFVYPLREGGEADYRFASGDTTSISLPRGREVRLLELKVIPRRSDFRLMSGSLWFDADSYGLVRAVFRPARPFDIRRDLDSADRRDIPIWLSAGAEVKYVTLEYGLYETRWWMPRYMATDLVVTMGAIAGMPVRFERTYTDYHVEGGTPPDPARPFRPAGTTRTSARYLAAVTAADSARLDSTRAVRRDSVRTCVRQAREDSTVQDLEREERRRAVRVKVRACFSDRDSSLVVVVPPDTAALLANPLLGRPILEMGDVISENELEQFGRDIGRLAGEPWQFHPVLPRRLTDLLGHLRYNRVEALSIGVGGSLDLGRLKLDGLVRYGLADREPGAELGLVRPAGAATLRLAGYRRLAAANEDMEPLRLYNSVSSFVWQHDEGEYFRAWGGELTLATGSRWLEARLFGERQRPVSVNTDVSLPHLFNSANVFRANITAQDADEAGAALTVRGAKLVAPRLTIGAEASVSGATGTFRYGRGALTLRTVVDLPGPFTWGLHLGAGSSTGTVPVQSFWYIGGTPTLRGYDSGVLAGDAFWRGRLEAGTRSPAARLTLFADAGWAGPRAVFRDGRALWGAGVGFSALDGLVRMDLARALSGPKGWRFVLYVDGVL